MLIIESGRMLTQGFHLRCQPLDFCYRNKPGDVDPAGRPPSLLGQLLFSPLEQSQSTPPPQQRNNRRRWLDLAGSRKQSTRGLLYLRRYCAMLVTIWPSRPPVSVTICFRPRLRPIGAHLNKHGYPRLARPSCVYKCEYAAEELSIREVPSNQPPEMQRWGANNTVRMHF